MRLRRLIVFSSALVTALGLAASPPAQAATAHFTKVAAATAGPELEINFVERGLQPGQNYAYTGSSSGSETFQCYKSRTFTPTHKKITVEASSEADPRAYQANAEGVVRGFIFEDLISQIPTTFHCGARSELIPIHVCYSPYDLVQFAEPFDVYYFPDATQVCGPIEPD
jgi:hypothetical protein